jgi:hypothetical protein
MSTVSAVDPATHAALFQTYFPLESVPAEIRPLIEARAEAVSAGLLSAVQSQPALAGLLGLLTDPQAIPQPLLRYLESLDDPGVKAFLAGGYAPLTPDQRDSVWDAFIEGPAPLTAIAATVRLVYLSAIWDLPLAGPITGIQTPQVFVDNIDVYVAAHMPTIPASVLRYDAATQEVTCTDGRSIDYLVVGSGPGGATVAHDLQQAGRRVVLLDKGPFVVWGSMDTRSYSALMYEQNSARTSDGAILVRSGQTVGGGTTVNIDLAFSPLEATVQTKLRDWIAEGRIDGRFYTLENLSRVYSSIRDDIGTRELSESELNRDNLVLWNGAKAFGVDPLLYHLNRFPEGRSPSPVDDKRDASRQLLLPAIQDPTNPLSLVPDADAVDLLFDGSDPPRATGVRFVAQAPWTDQKNTIVDPCKLGIPPGTTVTIRADNVVVAAGTIGSARLLLRAAGANPTVLDNGPGSQIGKGLVMHPSLPIIGVFEEEIDLLQGLDSATHVDAFGPTPGFIYETMSGLPAYGALLVPGRGEDVYRIISQFQNSAGFGLMRIDSSAPTNCVRLNADGVNVDLDYVLTDEDKQQMQLGTAIAIRMMFLAGAKTVVIPSNENVLDLPDYRPTHPLFLTDPAQADLVEQHLEFVPNRTLLTSAHLQGTNKMGADPASAVVSTKQRVWSASGQEIPNLYVMDSSIFPTSVGANPMQSIYTFARIFSERLVAGMD